jgi:hypothetical protein
LLLFKKEYKKNKKIKVAWHTYLWNRLNHIHLMLREMCRIVKNTRMFCLWCRLHLMRVTKTPVMALRKQKRKHPETCQPPPTVLIWATTWASIHKSSHWFPNWSKFMFLLPQTLFLVELEIDGNEKQGEWIRGVVLDHKQIFEIFHDNKTSIWERRAHISKSIR